MIGNTQINNAAEVGVPVTNIVVSHSAVVCFFAIATDPRGPIVLNYACVILRAQTAEQFFV